MSDFNLGALGVPVPVSYRVEQVYGPGPNGTQMWVKLYLAGPTGIQVHFLDGDQADILGGLLKKGGRAAKAGLWVDGRINGSAVLLGEEGRDGAQGDGDGVG